MCSAFLFVLVLVLVLEEEKGDRNLLPERPEGCFAQKVPVPFFLTFGTWGGLACNSRGKMSRYRLGEPEPE